MSKRSDWKLLGRTIGTGTGWDDNDFIAFVIYDFEPRTGLALPKGNVYVDLTQGTMQLTDDKGVAFEVVDLVQALQSLPLEPDSDPISIED